MASLSDADNFVHLSGSHHVSNGRWPERTTAEFYSASQPRDKAGKWTRLGGRGFAPNQLGQQARSDYRKANGISHFAPPSDFSGVVVDPKARAKAARAYLRMSSMDPKALPAYESLRSEVREQYEYMTKKLGIKVVVTKDDPYATVEEMMDDINKNKTLKVMSTASTGGHPFFSNEENDMFRAVHDFFGHGATGRDFSRHGERASYLSHASMMKNEDSIRALFTETEMQNAALINTGQFQEQKIGLAPDSMVFDGLQRSTGLQASAAVFACYEKACAPPPAGKGGSSKGGLRMTRAGIRKVANLLKNPDGGFTLNTRLQPIKKGFAVALSKSDRLIHSKDLFDENGNPNPKLRDLLKDRLEAAHGMKIPSGTEVGIGGWHNPEDGKVEINVTVVFPPSARRRAMSFAQKQDQISMAQLDPFEIIDTGGTGGDRSVTAAAVPVDKALYAKVKAEAKRKFDVYPSAYANGWLAQEYKRRGGEYKGRKRTVVGLKKWFKEEWVDISRPKKGGGFEPCGRKDASEGAYPKCVPASKAARMTPEQIESAVRRKRRAESEGDREGKKPINVSTFEVKRKPRLKDPRGGLTPAGRKAFGGNLKPGVKNYDSASTADKKRWISWARRFYARDTYPPFVNPDGTPTRFALTARAWGEPVPKNAADARRIAAKAAMRAERLKAEGR